MANLPRSTLHPLQRVQNCAAKTILQRSRYDSSTEARKELHWLPIEERVMFKTLCISHHCIHEVAPAYLCSMFIKSDPKVYNLRSSNSNAYNVPKSKCKTFGDRAFEVNGPRMWNALPTDIKHEDDFPQFKIKLKTYLFKKCYCL